MERELLGLAAGFLVALLTTPVGVSGAVFLLPVQLSLFSVPNPRVTPTNLLYNVVATPGGIARFSTRGRVDHRLALTVLSGSLPGVAIGAVIRVYVAADPTTFRLLAAAVLAPVAILILRPPRPGATPRTLTAPTIRAIAFGVGVIGGIYGIGGGSLLGPILVSTGMAVAAVAPVALIVTWLTSLVGVGVYALLAIHATGTISPDWALGLSIGLGGLAGGWVGAAIQPRIPERALRTALGVLALGLAVGYLAQALA